MTGQDPRLVRLQELQNEIDTFPGARIGLTPADRGGTGRTGVTTAQGYSALMKRRMEYAQLLAGLHAAAGER